MATLVVTSNNLEEANQSDAAPNDENQRPNFDESITIEKFLERKCEFLVQELQQNAVELCNKLRAEWELGKADLLQTVSNSADTIAEHDLVLFAAEGFYEGQKWTLHPRNGQPPLWIGRSSGRKFKDHGVSLSKDSEVSTSHGKIEAINGQVFYTDTGSTNGSIIQGIGRLDPEEPHQIVNEMRIQIGGTVFVCQLMAV